MQLFNNMYNNIYDNPFFENILKYNKDFIKNNDLYNKSKNIENIKIKVIPFALNNLNINKNITSLIINKELNKKDLNNLINEIKKDILINISFTNEEIYNILY